MREPCVRTLVLGACVVFASCNTAPEPPPPADAGGDPCDDCDDGLFCNGVEGCADGACTPGPSPCAAGETCDEATDACRTPCGEPDADGDGDDSTECGGGDCDDEDASRSSTAVEVCDDDGVDEDCNPDTFGDRDRDGDLALDGECCNGTTCGSDCDDARPGVNPTSPEVCDTIDNDCDVAIDEGRTITCYLDDDRDRYAPAGAATSIACECPAGTTTMPPEGGTIDCDDAVASRSPEGSEVCNGEDDDCDGDPDEGLLVTCYVDADDDGFAPAGAPAMMLCPRDCGAGTTPRAPGLGATDCDDSNAMRSPDEVEGCTANLIDDDCDGMIDDLAGDLWYRDCDTDGYGDRMDTMPVRACAMPGTVPTCGGGGGWVPNDASDCNDRSAAVRPGTRSGDTVPLEVCDAIDNDCDAATVDGRSETWFNAPCDGADGDACREGVQSCGAGGVDMVCTDPAGETDVELCSTTSAPRGSGAMAGDEDCDGTVDETAAANAECLARGLPPQVATTACSAGACVIASCTSGYQDCNASAGCESACFWRGCASGSCDEAVSVSTYFSGSSRVASCAARESGRVVCWGRAADGSMALTPVVATGITNAVRVDGRWALGSDGRVYRQQGGAGFAYVELSGLGNVTSMGVLLQDNGLDQGCFLRSDRTVICSNYPIGGARGDGIESTTATIGLGVVTGLSDAVEVVGTYYGGCARRAGGTVVCWGGNHYGNLGDGVATHRSCSLPSGVVFDCSPTFVTVSGITNAVEIAGYDYSMCARLATGEVRCWGYGAGPRATATCMFGSGTSFGCSRTPITVAGLTATRLFPSSSNQVALTSAGQLVEIYADNSLIALPALGATPVDLEHRNPGPPHIGTCALAAGGAVSCRGSNSFGEIGDGTTTMRNWTAVLSPP